LVIREKLDVFTEEDIKFSRQWICVLRPAKIAKGVLKKYKGTNRKTYKEKKRIE